MNKPLYYIGLMSGTSLDAVDAVLMDFNSTHPRLIATHTAPITDELKKNILDATSSIKKITINQFGLLHSQLGHFFADVVLLLLEKSNIPPDQIYAIGSPGQTIFHNPCTTYPFTLQVGDANIIAVRTGITTITDFRGKDVALHGQGAPFAPVFHEVLFRTSQENRCVINIGGIANITFLPAKSTIPITGFDIGPGNILLNAWISAQQRLPFDYDGQWAEGGRCHKPLLKTLLNDPYFLKVPPKSTGREYFNLAWLERYLVSFPDLTPQDIQTTLTELTATAITQTVKKSSSTVSTLLLCGGGANNCYLFNLIKSLLKNVTVIKTNALGIDVRFIEAALFAWLAKQRINEKKINLCNVTGASRPAILGAIYSPI